MGDLLRHYKHASDGGAGRRVEGSILIFTPPVRIKFRGNALKIMHTSSNTFRTDDRMPELSAGENDSSFKPDLNRQVEFEQVVSRCLPQLRRMAMRRLRNREDAEDAVQDALLSAFKHIADFEGRAQMSSWLMAIVINSVRMQLRRRLQYTMVSIDAHPEHSQSTFAESLADPRPTAERIVAHIELCQLVTKFVKRLPRSQRAALHLRHANGLSIKEAAQVLEVPVGTVKAHLTRGRARLAQLVFGATNAARSADFKTRRGLLSGLRRRQQRPQDAFPILLANFREQGIRRDSAAA
jgi:RNA polymerase sigma-70 factor, ECF subfamily